MYLMQMQPQGWVIVSTEDTARPILAYSLEDSISTITDIPPGMKWLVGTYDKHIKKLRKNVVKLEKEEFKNQWKELKKESKQFIAQNSDSNASSESISLAEESVTLDAAFPELDDAVRLYSTVNWGQCSFYNDQVPFDTASGCGDNRVYVGCVAVAMGEIMRYHSYPNNLGIGTHQYTHEIYGILSADYAHTDYNVGPTMTSTEVARLLSHAGISVDMNYTINGSGARPIDAPHGFEHFDYWTGGYSSAIDYTASNWESKIIQNLRQGFPVYYRGVDLNVLSDPDDNVGHAFVIEGFETEGGKEFYVNWGWYGSYNGWFALMDLSPASYEFLYYHGAIFHIKPNTATYRDRYEGDNDSTVSSYIVVGERQDGHSIDPATDTDWITFFLTSTTTVTIETFSDDQDANTRMWLYDVNGNQIAYNDNKGDPLTSKIIKTLGFGRYYIKIDEYGNNDVIQSYDLRITQ